MRPARWALRRRQFGAGHPLIFRPRRAGRARDPSCEKSAGCRVLLLTAPDTQTAWPQQRTDFDRILKGLSRSRPALDDPSGSARLPLLREVGQGMPILHQQWSRRGCFKKTHTSGRPEAALGGGATIDAGQDATRRCLGRGGLSAGEGSQPAGVSWEDTDSTDETESVVDTSIKRVMPAVESELAVPEMADGTEAVAVLARAGKGEGPLMYPARAPKISAGSSAAASKPGRGARVASTAHGTRTRVAKETTALPTARRMLRRSAITRPNLRAVATTDAPSQVQKTRVHRSRDGPLRRLRRCVSGPPRMLQGSVRTNSSPAKGLFLRDGRGQPSYTGGVSRCPLVWAISRPSRAAAEDSSLHLPPLLNQARSFHGSCRAACGPSP